MKKVFIYLINIYQKTLSPDHGFLKKVNIIKKPVCVFYPTCSEYSKEAIEKYGSLKGIGMTAVRLSRCHPWQKNHLDPVRSRSPRGDRSTRFARAASNGVDPLK